MSESNVTPQIKEAGARFWRMFVLVLATVLVLSIFIGMGFLVYRQRMGPGPLVLFSGIVVGYLIRVAQDVI